MRISDWSSDVCSSDLVRYVCPCGADQEIDLVLTTLQTFQNNLLSVEACRDKDDDADPVDLHPCRMRRAVEGADNAHAEIGGSRKAGDRKSTRLTSSHSCADRMPLSAYTKKKTTTNQ